MFAIIQISDLKKIYIFLQQKLQWRPANLILINMIIITSFDDTIILLIIIY